MAISRKHSRPIGVRGTPFRWKVRFNDSRGTATLSVWTEDDPPSLLTVLVTNVWEDPHYPTEPPGGYPFTPAYVRSAIEQAMEDGWKPRNAGSKMVLQLPAPAREWSREDIEALLAEPNAEPPTPPPAPDRGTAP